MSDLTKYQGNFPAIPGKTRPLIVLINVSYHRNWCEYAVNIQNILRIFNEFTQLILRIFTYRPGRVPCANLLKLPEKCTDVPDVFFRIVVHGKVGSAFYHNKPCTGRKLLK